jgi:hypothetical protein
VVSEDDKATEVRIGDGETKDLGHFGAFLDAGWDDHARPVLLVNTSDDRYELVDARARRTVAAATVEDAVMPRGSLLPDGRSGLIASGDHQLWRLDRAGAEPTGIPNADRPGVVRSLPDGRVVVGGAAGPARVYDIDSAVDLGVVCREISYLVMVRSTHDGAMVSCLGPRQATLWPVPNGPLTRVSPDLPAQTELSGAGATITAEGSSVRVQSDGADEPTDVEVGLGRVTALALHPAGRQVLVATDRGEVRIVDMTAEPAVVVAWRVPDGSSGTGASWSGRPLVSTSAGAVWEAPTCPGCGTDDGMIAFLRTRLERCWTANNLAFVGDATRRRLGVEVCDAGNGD